MKLKDCLFVLLIFLALVATWDVTVGQIFQSAGSAGLDSGRSFLNNLDKSRRQNQFIPSGR